MSMLDLHLTPFKFLDCKFLSKSGKVSNLVPICLEIDIRCKILAYQCQTHTQRL